MKSLFAALLDIVTGRRKQATETANYFRAIENAIKADQTCRLWSTPIGATAIMHGVERVGASESASGDSGK